MIKLISLPFDRLGDMSHANKARLLEEIKRQLDNYQNMSALEKKIESY